MKQLFFILSLCSGLSLLAQDAKFTATVTKTTVALNSKFKVEFQLENGQGSGFQAPEFEDFTVVAGPSTSSAMSIVNGVVTQSFSYVYYLKPREIGDFVIKTAKIKVKDKTLETDNVSIKVVEESNDTEDEQFQHSDPFQGFFQRQMPRQQQEMPKKKRKSYQL